MAVIVWALPPGGVRPGYVSAREAGGSIGGPAYISGGTD